MKKTTLTFSHKNTTRGFSLVEMIVAMGIFALVAVVALGALVKIISANKKAQSIQAAVTNINYALDTMTREMRAGITYHCTESRSFLTTGDVDRESCSDFRNRSNTVYLAFKSSNVDPNQPTCRLIYAYRLEKISQDDEFQLTKAQQSECGGDFSQFDPILDDNVTLTGYYLNVTNETFPLATLRLSGYSGVREREKTFFDVQTAVAPRVK